MFDYRLSCSIDCYKTKTSDLLMLKRLPVTSGFSRIYDNIGSSESQGIEATVNFIILNNKDFEWDAYANFAWNKNKITSLATKEDDLSNGWFVGRPISTIYDYEMEGIWQIGEEAEAAKYNCVPGDIKIKDQEGTSEGITADDKTFIGQSSPKFIASMGSNFKLKDLDFSFNISGRFGHLINNSAYGYNLITSGNRQVVDVDYWTPDNPSNRWPRASGDIANRGLCAYFKGDYIKLQDITIGYDFASLASKGLHLNLTKLRLYFQMRNFWYLHNAAGKNINPESSNFELTVPKSLVFGLNVNF